MIISENPFVVNYGSDGSKITILDQLANWKQSFGEVTADTRNFVEEFKRIGSDNVNLNELIQKFSDVDKAVVEAAEKIKYGDEKICAIDTAMQNAATKGSQFAASLKNIAVNAGSILLINLAIQAGKLAWDNLNVTVEEQAAKVNSLQASYQNLQSEYEQLSSKQDLTDAEQKRLSYLERRLELDERILKAEEHQLFKEKTGRKFTDRFDSDNYYTKYQLDTRWDKWGLLSSFSPEYLKSYGHLSELYAQKMTEIKAAQESIDAWTESSSHLEEGSGEWNLYQTSIDAARNRQADAIKELSENEDQLIINLGDYADVIGDLETQLDSGSLNDEDTKNA